MPVTLRGRDAIAVFGLVDRRDGGTAAHRGNRHLGVARDEGDHLRHRHEAVGVAAVVLVAGQASLPVGSQQPQRVPTLVAPRVGHLTALEHHVVDPAFAETAARGESGVSGADDDRGNAFDGSTCCGGERSGTWTVTFVGS
jgi:hypothetical protein